MWEASDRELCQLARSDLAEIPCPKMLRGSSHLPDIRSYSSFSYEIEIKIIIKF